MLEGKILNQLIHQIPSEKIPQTNFRVKKKTSDNNIKWMTFEIVLFLVMFIHFTFFDLWKKYVNALPNNLFKTILTISTHPYALIGSGITMVIIFSTILYKLIRTQKNKNVFRKLNLQGNEIEIFEESDDSYFDKYLNEVLYLFENADADVIVFEDMDRFNVNRIFERLREVNTLANIQLQKEENRILRFFFTYYVMIFLILKIEQSFLITLFQLFLSWIAPIHLISLYLISRIVEYLKSLMKVFCRDYLYILMICVF